MNATDRIKLVEAYLAQRGQLAEWYIPVGQVATEPQKPVTPAIGR